MTRTKKREGTILRKFNRVNDLSRIKPSAAARHLNTGFSPGVQSFMPARSLRYERNVSPAGFHQQLRSRKP